MNLVKLKQLATSEISGWAVGPLGLVTGEVVRPSQTGNFVTSNDNNDFEVDVLGRVLNISGQVYNTGQLVLTGYLNATGELLNSRLFTTGQTLLLQTSGVSGSIYNTGQTVLNLIVGLSGAFDNSGAFLERKIGAESGTFNTSGLNLFNLITGLSGAFDRSGLNNFNLLTSLSGAFDTTGQRLKSDIDVLFAGFTKVNNLSGSISITGTGLVVSYQAGQTIYLSGISGTAPVANVVSISNLTGTPFITGTGSITVTTFGSGIYISGDFVAASETGVFATTGQVSLTGQTLWNRDLEISGYLLNQIVASNAGVSSVNGISGSINISGTGNVFVTTGNGFLLISGTTQGNVPHWLLYSTDIFTPSSVEDDFDTPYLASKWTGINVNVDSTGISNSHFWIYPRASASSTGRSSFVQGVTTGYDWEIEMKCNFLPKFINNQQIGLVIGNATSTKNTLLGYEYTSSANQFVIRHNNAYNSSSSIAIEGAVSGYSNDFKDAYFRLQSRSNLMNFDYSNNGIVWRTIRNFTYTGNAATVDQVGFTINPNAAQIIMAVDYFRATGLS